MSIKELNPSNALVQEMREQWQKLTAILVDRYGDAEITSDGHRHTTLNIDMADLDRFSKAYSGEMPTIVIQSKADKIILIVESESDATKRAKDAGYL